jgi:hypothetical protein
MLPIFEIALSLTALAVALWLRPWRMLQGALLTLALASVVLLPGRGCCYKLCRKAFKSSCLVLACCCSRWAGRSPCWFRPSR